jgi:serine/threonine-protein kinase
LSRFQREAEVLAALNHPNIATIYDLAQAGDTRFLVLEIVEGETLADRIARGPIPLEDTLHIAKQICEALEAAHERDIIHRDLKPANIKLTADGKAKVLDFGLAKIFSKDRRDASASNSPTLSMAATQQGIILGTAAYMSPEQARGRNVDKRADVFAFGCILYEMLTGKPAFEGSDVSEILASVIKSEPRWDAIPSTTPPVLRVFLRRCLEKDTRRRIHDIGDVRLALEGSFDEIGGQAILPGSPQFRPHRWHLPLAAVIAAAAAVLITVVVFQFMVHPRPGAIIRFTAEAPNGIGLGIGAQDPDIAISPDGRTIVYVAGGQASSQLYVRRLNELQGTPLPGINRARNPFFSPDGNWIGFFEGSTLKKVPENGGSAITICNLVGNPRGASWGAGDVIIFSTTATGLMRVPATGGTPEVLTKPDPSKGEFGHILPEVLPGGRTVVFTVAQQSGSPENAEIDLMEMQSRRRTVLIRGGSNPHYAASGHIVYGANGTLWAVPFDVDKLQVHGAPVQIAEHVMMKVSGAFNFSIAQDGSLVYVPGEAVGPPQFALDWVDRQGHEEPIPAPVRSYQSARISPDGTQVALEIRDQENDIWTWDFARKTLTQLTFDPGFNRGVAWSPDGRRLAFSRQLKDSEHVYWQSADGTGMPELLAGGPALDTPTSFSPDGTKLLFNTQNDGHPDIGIIDVKSHKREILLKTPGSKGNAEFSPDGRWILYQSDNESGRRGTYVRPFPNVDGGLWQFPVGSVRAAAWSRNGKEIILPGSTMSRLTANF